MRFLAIVLLALGAVSRASSDDVPNRLIRATAWVRTTTQGVGTGWVVDVKRRWLITNLHVVGEQDRVEAFFAVERDGKLIADRQYYLENQKTLHEEGKAVRGKVILRREKSDLALIELEKLPTGVEALPLAEKLPGPGRVVYSVGHRHDSEALWNCCTGEVRQVGKLTDGYFWRGRKLAANVQCLLIQTPINIGDSGGALVNECGDVVGVVSGVRWQAPITAIAIQASEVRSLLDEAEKKDPQHPTPAINATEIYRKMVAATCWVRPNATEGRTAGWVIDKKRKLVLTNANGVGTSDLVDVLFPLFEKNGLVAEADAYADRIGLRKRRHLVRGLVLMRDPKRDLALVELESLPNDTTEIALAKKEPLPAEKVHVVSHPNGVELLWLYSTGVVRQAANIELVGSSMGEAIKPRTLLLQIPHQAGSAGGPVVNERGDVVGMMAAKEGAQQQLGYAIEAKELAMFQESATPRFAPKTADEFHKRGNFLFSRFRIDSAYENLKKASELDPQSSSILPDLIRAAGFAGQTGIQLKVAEQLLALDRESPHYRVIYADVLASQQYKTEAKRICDAVLAKDRKNALAYLVRGQLKVGKEALADFDDAIYYEPSLVFAYRLRAFVHQELGNEDKELADWSRAIELDPYLPGPIVQRARLYLKKNEPKRSVADYERLIELLPDNGGFHRDLANAWLVQGDESKALPALVAAYRWEPRLMRKPVLEDVIKHGQDQVRRWPDDTSKQAKWYEQSLTAIRSASNDMSFRSQIDQALRGRKKDWDDKQWGSELERSIMQLASK